MTLEFRDTEAPREVTPRIVVMGAGGAGGNAVNTMISKELEGVEFVAANTDAQALGQSRASVRLQIGMGVTEGLGVGGAPDLGGEAAEESAEQIAATLEGAHMCFITAGMGGGTGTGAAPVIARIARSLGILTVGVVTKPFDFEGRRRMTVAEAGLELLQKEVDTLIVIPNQNLFRIATERTPFAEAFTLADEVLYQGVKGVTDLMVRPGLINLDFNDVRAVMDEMGKAMMGSGEAEGDNRALEAAEKAIDNPLLDGVKLKGARGVLINITGDDQLSMFEVDEAANRICKEVDPDAKIFFGASIDPDLAGKVRVSVVATGIGPMAQFAAGDGHRASASVTKSSVPQAAPKPPRPTMEAPASNVAAAARVSAAPFGAQHTSPAMNANAEPLRPGPAPREMVEPPRMPPSAPEAPAQSQPVEPPRVEQSRMEMERSAARAPTAERLPHPGAGGHASPAVGDSEDTPTPHKDLVRKMTSDSARRGDQPKREGLRVEIPSFLRRQV